MSPTIPILSALLLSLISGSTADGQRMDPVSLLRQTLRYWWKIYKTYSEEVTLGYCWADYLLEISNELSMNLSAPLPVATRDRSDTIVGATKSQQNPFPRNVMVDAATPHLRKTRKGKHPREKRSSYATARFTVSEFTNDPADEHRVVASRSKIRKRGKRIMSKTERASRAAPNNYTGRSSKIDENGRTARAIDFCARRRRRAVSIVLELFRDERKAPRGGHEFSSHGTSSHTVNPALNPRDDDKVNSGSTDFGEEDSRRKVWLTSHRDSFIEDAFASRSFSLRVAREGSLGGQRFPFRRYSSSRKRNSRVDKMLSDPWMPKRDHGTEEDLAGRRSSLNKNGSSSTPSRSKFRRIHTDAKCHRVSAVVKLMDSAGNSSCDPTINSKTPRRKPRELSRDSLLSPRGGSAIAERSLFKFRGSGREALKRDVLLQFKMVRGNDTKKQEESSWNGRDVSAATIHPSFLSEFKRSQQQMLYETHGVSPVPTIPQKSRQDDDSIRTARNAFSLSSIGRLIGNYEDSATQSTQHSKLIVLQASQDQLPLRQRSSSVSSIHSFVVAVFRTLGMFVQMGRQIMDVIQTNAVLACTKKYVLAKIVKWIEA